jgi:methylated-DNA-protein-cysteine methyltransferase-like protein
LHVSLGKGEVVMPSKLNEDFLYQVYSVVEEIPRGCVATYGQIAALIGYDRNSRMVGRALRMAEIYGEFPCYRVVNAQGRLTPGWAEQRDLLGEEGVHFRANGCVDLENHLWRD